MSLTDHPYFKALSEKHKSMSDDEIRLHACMMATVIGNYESLIEATVKHCGSLENRLDLEQAVLRKIAIEIRRVASLFASGFDREANELLAVIVDDCGAHAEQQAPIDGSVSFPPLSEIWPDWLTPGRS